MNEDVNVQAADTNAEGGNSAPAAETPATGGKTYDEAYVNNLIAQMNAESEASRAAAVEEALKKERMTAEEKSKYEADEREASIAKREKEINLRELKADTKGMLAKVNLPDVFADIVIGSDAAVTQKNIDVLKSAFDKAVQEQVETRLRGRTPSAGTGSGSSDSDEIGDIINRTLGL